MKIERFEDIEAWQLARKLTQKSVQTVRGFINYLKKYGERKATNREPKTVNPEPDDIYKPNPREAIKERAQPD